MNDTILGVVLGAAIAAVPTIISAILDYKKQSARLAHEKDLHAMELFRTEKQVALAEYALQLGAMDSSSIQGDFSIDRYLAASQKASIFVSDETRTLILKADEYAFGRWGHFDRTLCTHNDKAKYFSKDELSAALYRELSQEPTTRK